MKQVWWRLLSLYIVTLSDLILDINIEVLTFVWYFKVKREKKQTFTDFFRITQTVVYILENKWKLENLILNIFINIDIIPIY